MEKANYRVNLGLIRELFPDKAAITVVECAKVLSCSKNTVYSYINRAKNPLPAKRVSEKKVVIPIASLANWMA